MMKGTWTDAEFCQALRLLRRGLTPAETGRTLGRSEAAVRLKLIKAGYSSRLVDRGDSAPLPEEERSRSPQLNTQPGSEGSEWNLTSASMDDAKALLEARDIRARMRMDRTSAIEFAQRDRLLEIFRNALSECRIAYHIEPPPKPANQGREMNSAVLLLGDCHCGKVCDPAESEGRGIYNPAYFLARLALLEQEFLEMLRSSPPVDELVVLMLGDIIEGSLDHGAEREMNLLVSQQFALAAHALSQFLLRVASRVQTVRVYGVGGNHSRFPGQRRPPTIARESNLDNIVYRAIEMVITAAGATHVKFCLSDASRQQVRIKSTSVVILHGDQIRGGDFAVAGIKREVFASVLRHAPEGNIPDLWVTGDKHVPLSLAVGMGRWIINGAFPGEDTFSQRFAPARASQSVLWICPRKGRFIQAEIPLDHAKPTDPTPYGPTGTGRSIHP